MIESEEEISASLAGRVWETVNKFPGNPALEIGDRQYTYRDLYNAATSISDAVSSLENPDPFVALMADKSFTCYAAILGVLMAGKAYLPLNPRFPAARNLFMLEKAGVRVVIAGENSDDELDETLENCTSEVFIIFPEETEPVQNLNFIPKIVDPADPAYLLFTSGTTGKPKGVAVSHGNATCYLDNLIKYYDFGTDDRFTQIFDLTFDLSVHDIFLAWSTGACLVVPEDNSSFAMSRFIREKQPTVWFSVPSVVNLMDRMRLLKPGVFPSIRLSFFCGEALQGNTAQAWQNAVPQSGIINLYGPTEATIAITKYTLPGETGNWKMEIGVVSVGQIFDRNSFIINAENPADDRGELCLAGDQVVNNYLKNEQADREAFFKDPGSSRKFYRTGDIVKVDADGDLFYLGRKDSEVKISGYRVNLKEIENVLEGYDSVGQAVVIYDQPDESAGMILAFILNNDEHVELTDKSLDEHCRRQLPWYMVPGKFIFVNEIPLNENGKIDKSALKLAYINGK